MSVPDFNVQNVITGTGILYIAPAGTAFPSMTGPTAPTDTQWQTAGFVPAGYTDDGVQYAYTPQFKDITVDESMSAVDVRLIGEKLEINVKLAEVTLINLSKAIAGSTLVLGSGISTLAIGNPTNADQGEVVLGFVGPAPGNEANANVNGRVFQVWRAKASAAVTHHAQRKDKVVYNVKFTAIAQSTQPAGQQLSLITDFNQAGS